MSHKSVEKLVNHYCTAIAVDIQTDLLKAIFYHLNKKLSFAYFETALKKKQDGCHRYGFMVSILFALYWV